MSRPRTVQSDRSRRAERAAAKETAGHVTRPSRVKTVRASGAVPIKAPGAGS
jgi:hypothetical protein